MLTRRFAAAFVVCITTFSATAFFLSSAHTANAEGNSADAQCVVANDYYKYRYDKPKDTTFKENNKEYRNWYGHPCTDYTAGKATTGICIGSTTCRAEKTDGMTPETCMQAKTCDGVKPSEPTQGSGGAPATEPPSGSIPQPDGDTGGPMPNTPQPQPQTEPKPDGWNDDPFYRPDNSVTEMFEKTGPLPDWANTVLPQPNGPLGPGTAGGVGQFGGATSLTGESTGNGIEGGSSNESLLQQAYGTATGFNQAGTPQPDGWLDSAAKGWDAFKGGVDAGIDAFKESAAWQAVANEVTNLSKEVATSFDNLVNQDAQPASLSDQIISDAQKGMGLDAPAEPTEKFDFKEDAKLSVYGVCEGMPRGCNSVEGAPTTAVQHPGADGKGTNQIYTINDYADGKVPYVTTASSPDRFGETGVLKEVTYNDPFTGEQKTLTNVPYTVADTGSAFPVGTEKMDVPVTVPPDMYGNTPAINQMLGNQPFNQQYVAFAETDGIQPPSSTNVGGNNSSVFASNNSGIDFASAPANTGSSPFNDNNTGGGPWYAPENLTQLGQPSYNPGSTFQPAESFNSYEGNPWGGSNSAVSPEYSYNGSSYTSNPAFSSESYTSTDGFSSPGEWNPTPATYNDGSTLTELPDGSTQATTVGESDTALSDYLEQRAISNEQLAQEVQSDLNTLSEQAKLATDVDQAQADLDAAKSELSKTEADTQKYSDLEKEVAAREDRLEKLAAAANGETRPATRSLSVAEYPFSNATQLTEAQANDLYDQFGITGSPPGNPPNTGVALSGEGGPFSVDGNIPEPMMLSGEGGPFTTENTFTDPVPQNSGGIGSDAVAAPGQPDVVDSAANDAELGAFVQEQLASLSQNDFFDAAGSMVSPEIALNNAELKTFVDEQLASISQSDFLDAAGTMVSPELALNNAELDAFVKEQLATLSNDEFLTAAGTAVSPETTVPVDENVPVPEPTPTDPQRAVELANEKKYTLADPEGVKFFFMADPLTAALIPDSMKAKILEAADNRAETVTFTQSDLDAIRWDLANGLQANKMETLLGERTLGEAGYVRTDGNTNDRVAGFEDVGILQQLAAERQSAGVSGQPTDLATAPVDAGNNTVGIGSDAARSPGQPEVEVAVNNEALRSFVQDQLDTLIDPSTIPLTGEGGPFSVDGNIPEHLALSGEGWTHSTDGNFPEPLALSGEGGPYSTDGNIPEQIALSGEGEAVPATDLDTMQNEIDAMKTKLGGLEAYTPESVALEKEIAAKETALEKAAAAANEANEPAAEPIKDPPLPRERPNVLSYDKTSPIGKTGLEGLAKDVIPGYNTLSTAAKAQAVQAMRDALIDNPDVAKQLLGTNNNVIKNNDVVFPDKGTLNLDAFKDTDFQKDFADNIKTDQRLLTKELGGNTSNTIETFVGSLGASPKVTGANVSPTSVPAPVPSAPVTPVSNISAPSFNPPLAQKIATPSIFSSTPMPTTWTGIRFSTNPLLPLYIPPLGSFSWVRF